MEKYVICWAATPWAVSGCQALAAGEEADSRRGGGHESTMTVVVAGEFKCNWPSQQRHVCWVSTGSSVQCTWQWLNYFAQHFPPTAMYLLNNFPWPGMPLPQSLPAYFYSFFMTQIGMVTFVKPSLMSALIGIWSPSVSSDSTST